MSDYEVNMCLLAKANNHLAIRLHSKLAEKGGNIFFSPFSISVAMSMLLRGTCEDTASELHEFLGFDSVNLTVENVHGTFGKLFEILLGTNEFYTLAIANALAYHTDFKFKTDYKDDLQKLYKALALEVDFIRKNKEAVQEINKFVKKSTNDMIPKMFNRLGSDTRIVLLNATYFKGFWDKKFDKNCTRSLPFYNMGLPKNKKDVPMMSLKKKFAFCQNDTYQALELPYQGNDLAMLLLLPTEMTGLKALENTLTSDVIENIRKKMSEIKVDVQIPKLHLEFSKELKSDCVSLGLKKIFTSDGNFKGLSNSESLFVSSIVHKAVLDVNEEGSEAAAVTAIVMGRSISLGKVFEANHPFMFVIYDKRNNMILFMGRVEEL